MRMYRACCRRGHVAKIEKAAAMPVPPVFDLIAKTGKIPERDMYNIAQHGRRSGSGRCR